jgi:hypothetical protein
MAKAKAKVGAKAKKGQEKASGELVKEPETNSMKIARQLITKRNLIEETKEAMEPLGKELIEAMKKDNTSRLYVDGFTITVKYVESKNKVHIQKPKF